MKKETGFLLEHMDFIYRCSYRYCGNKADAEDLTQETFYRAWKNRHQLKDRDKCGSWLFSILRNLYLKEVYEKKRFQCVEIDSCEESLVIDERENIERILSSRWLQENLNLLEEKYKTPLILFYFSGISYREIGEMLDVPIGTVMSRISRAKGFLKKQILRRDDHRIIEYDFKKG